MNEKATRRLDALDMIVEKGMLKSYEIVNVSADNVEGEISENRNSDRLKLVFPDGDTIIVTAITTGMEDDALLRFE